jgi:hypothetical protein
MQSRLTASIVLLTVLVFTPSLALAQGGATGAISGTVQDQSSAVVPKAQVRISGIAGTVRDLVTDSTGTFTAPLLPVGTYTIIITTPGFAETRLSSVEVRVTETTRLTATLRPKALATQVDVQAQIANVETTTAVTGQVLTSRFARSRRYAHQCKRAARRQQQLSNRRHYCQRLQRRRIDEHSVTQPGRSTRIQSSDESLRCHPRPQRRR